MTTNNINPLEIRGGSSLRRAASDVYRSSQYKTTASIQLQKSPAEAEDSINNNAALKAFHTARLKSTLDFFRKKEELNKSNHGTSLSHGRPLSLHASFTYGHHGNSPPASSSYQNGTTLAKFGNIVQRSSEPKSYKNRPPVDSSDDKTPAARNTSSSQFSKMDAGSSTTLCKAGTNLNCAKTGVNPEGTAKGHTNSVKGQAGNDYSEFIGGLPTLEKLKRDIETYDKELHECDDYDKRRAFRAKIRDLRKQIKEEKYYKPDSTHRPSNGNQETSTVTTLPQTSITGNVQLAKAATPVRAHPAIIEEPISTDNKNTANSINTASETDNKKLITSKTNKNKEINNDTNILPRVIYNLEDQTVLDGQPCTFKCKFSAPDGTTVIWYHDSKLLESSDEIKQQFVEGNATLDIAEVFPDDEGVYKCVITYTDGSAETSAKLTVLGESDVECPQISVPLEDQRCAEGDQIKLRCIVCGKPQPTITWSRDGYPLFGAKRYTYNYDGHEAILVINDAITGDGGSYTCEARNKAGLASSECVVDVKASPLKKPEFLTVLPSTYSTSVGKNLTLTCHVTGRPRPQVTWYHKTTELVPCKQYVMKYDGDCVTLTLQNTTADMAGHYTCLASNSSGDIRCITTVSITGRTIEPGKPVFVTPLCDVVVADGTESFTLRCCIEGRPRPVVLWQKGRDFLRTGSRYIEKFDGREASLEIKQINRADADTYTCMCRNEFGKVKSTCTLTVQDSSDSPAAAKMSSKPDINSIDDEDELYKLMNATDDFEERKKIRARMREIREAKAGSDILRKAEDEQQKKLKELSEEGVSRTTKTEKSSDGVTTVTSTTVTTHKTKDGSATTTKQTKQITQISGLGGTSYAISKTSAASKPTGPRGARAAFQQMDKATAPAGGSKPNFLGGGGGGGRVTVQRSPSTIKQMLLDWCKSVTKEYEPKVCITNFSSSWNNGLAFCALIHHFYPDAFNFDELDPKKRRYNFTLAFDTAEKLADIAPLLDVEDMVRMKNPDWKCVFTYVQSFYRRFRNSPSTPTTPVTPVSPEPQTN